MTINNGLAVQRGGCEAGRDSTSGSAAVTAAVAAPPSVRQEQSRMWMTIGAIGEEKKLSEPWTSNPFLNSWLSSTLTSALWPSPFSSSAFDLPDPPDQRSPPFWPSGVGRP
jgi:hypothetical protein